jgi:filamentous hemagglutinin family protein
MCIQLLKPERFLPVRFVIFGFIQHTSPRSKYLLKRLQISFTKLLISSTFCFFLISSQFLYALPTDENVIDGSVAFERTENSLNVIASNNSIIEWGNFDIASNESVNFTLPDANAFSLNRILNSSVTQIFGQLTANGNLVLINTNGFYFAPQSMVNVGGLIASAHEITNANFLSGQYIFSGVDNIASSQTSILNEGTIQSNNQMAILIADAIENRGVIEAPVVALAAGNEVEVQLNGLVSVIINKKTAHQILDKDNQPITDQIKNTGTISGNKVLLNAQGVSGVFHNAVNAQGMIQGDTIVEGEEGRIQIIASERIQISNLNLAAPEVTMESKSDIVVSGDVTNDSGDMVFTAEGAFLQAEGTTVKTVHSGNITVSSNGESTLANINSAGDITLKATGPLVHYTQHQGSSVEAAGSFTIATGVTLSAANTQYEVARNWMNFGQFDAQVSLVKLVGPLESTVIGSNTFYSLSIDEPGKIVNFDSGQTQEILGTLTLRGSFGSLLVLRSTEAGMPWMINPLGATNLSYLDLMDSSNINIHGPPALAHSKNSLGNSGWSFEEVIWTGSEDSNLSNAANWDGGFIPGFGDKVRFTALGDITIHGGHLEAAEISIISQNGNINIDSDLHANSHIFISALNGTITARGFMETNLLSGTIVFKAQGLDLGGTYRASFIDFDPADIWINTAINTTGAVTFTASNDIFVNANVTTDAGALSFTADSDNDGQGSFIQSATAVITTTTSGAITIKAASATVYQIVSAGTIGIQGVISTGMTGNIVINGTLTANSAIDIFTLADLTIAASITSSASNITLGADISPNGVGNLILSGNPTFQAGAAGSHTITAANSLDINGTTLTVGGQTATLAQGTSLTLTTTSATGNITVSGTVTESSTISLNAYAGNIAINADIMGSSNVTINADLDNTAPAGNLTFSNNPTIQAGAASTHTILVGNSFDINGTTLTVGGQTATLSQGTSLSLTSTGATGTITVSGVVTETSSITLNTFDGGISINAGITGSSNVTIAADSDNDGTGDLTLSGNPTIQAGAASTHTIKAANAMDINGTTLTVGGQTATLSQGTALILTSTGTTGAITVSGVVTETSSISLSSYDGGITINAGITGSASVTITADFDNDGTGDLTLSGNPTIQAGAASSHSIKAANALDINGTTLTVGGQTATLSQGTGLSLISTGSSGTVTVSGAVTETSFITLNSYDGGIIINANVISSSNPTIDADVDDDGVGSLSFSNNPTIQAGAGNIHRITAANSLDISGTTLTAGGQTATLSQGVELHLISTGGSITVSGAVTVSNEIELSSFDGGIAVNADVTAGSTLTINADADSDGTGNLTFSNNPTIQPSAFTSHNITLANAVDINGTTWTIGGQTATFSQGSSMFIQTTGASGSITISGAIVETGTMGLRTQDGGIILNASVTGNAVTIDADTDSDGIGDLTLSGNPTIQAGVAQVHTIKAANAMTINGTTLTIGGQTATLSQGTALILTSTGAAGSITVSGAVTETSTISLKTFDGGITINGDLTGSSVTLIADNDSDGTGNFTHTSGTITSSGNSNVTITGAAVSLGAITANSGSNDILVTASGNITSNSANFTALTVFLKSTAGNIGTSGTPIPLGAGDYIDAQATTGNIFLTESGAVTVRAFEESGGFRDLGIGTNTATYGAQSQDIGSNLRYATTATANLTVPGNFTIISATSFNLGGGTLTFTGSGNITDNNVTKQELGNVVLSAGAFTRTATTALDMTSLTVNAAHTFIQGAFALNISQNLSIANTGVFTKSSNASALTFDGTTASTITDSNGGTQNLGVVVINKTSGVTATDTVTLGSNIVVDSMTIGAGDTLDVSNGNNYSISNAGNWTNNGTFTARNGTVTLNGTADQAITMGSGSFYNLTVNNTGAAGSDDITFVGNLDIDNTFTLTDGNFHAPAVGNTFAVGDDFLVTGGTFDANGGRVTLDTTSTAIVNANGAGAGTITFFDLSIVTAGKTIQFGAGDTFVITSANTWTVTGSSGNNIILESTTPTTAWMVNPAGFNVSFVTVSDSTNISGTDITPTNSTNALRNIGWLFPSAAAASTPSFPQDSIDSIIDIIGMGIPTIPIIPIILTSGEIIIIPSSVPLAPSPTPAPTGTSTSSTPSEPSAASAPTESTSSTAPTESTSSGQSTSSSEGSNEPNSPQNPDPNGDNGGSNTQEKDSDEFAFFKEANSKQTKVVVYEGLVYVVSHTGNAVYVRPGKETVVGKSGTPSAPINHIRVSFEKAALVEIGYTFVSTEKTKEIVKRMIFLAAES